MKPYLALTIRPITFKAACAFVKTHHRHNKPPQGMKFALRVVEGEGERERTVGVAMVGRPVARALDDGLTVEVNRTCVLDNAPNANSILYGAAWRVAKEMGYERAVTYTQGDEPGTSLKAAGWVRAADLDARGSWAESSGAKCKVKRDPIGNGGVPRVRWEIKRR